MGNVENRSVLLAQYIIENKDTVRGAAKKFKVSKSTVHKDVSERLKKVNPGLHAQVKKILDINKRERHIRGGIATRKKYKGE
ncbi:MAG: sporulation transcriptional regulator SpoIIID [Oscillospiraceae bacterium]|nr:sporulation transcriptional regulator SpoIIID [Oscillospiraceae bacterium]